MGARHAVGLLAFALVAAPSLSADAHGINSASLRLTEVDEGTFRVQWTSSSESLERDLATPVVFPAACRFVPPWLQCGKAGLVGTLAFPWLAGAETEVMVAVDWRQGERLLRVVTGKSPRLVIYSTPASSGLGFLGPVAADYTRLGVEHILTGYDHLLFIVALALLVRGGRRMVATVTAFTVAHSLTLAAAVLGLVHLPPAPVEAIIALSIVLVSAEALRPPGSLIHRAPWAVSFAFGLLHGLGFASALLAAGLPERHVPAALLFFNLGVELGQLAILALLGLLASLAVRLRLRPAWLRPGLGYAIGSIAAFWSIERVLAVLGI